MAKPPSGSASGSTFAIDVSDAPRFATSFSRQVIRFFAAVMVGFLLLSAWGLVGLVFDLRISERILQGIIVSSIVIAPLIAVFLFPWRKNQKCAERIKLTPYGVSYAEVRRVVKATLYRSVAYHPRFWAAANFCLALSIFVYLIINEREILRASNGAAMLASGLLVALLFFLNGVRTYGSRTGFTKYLVVSFVRLVGVIFIPCLWLAAFGVVLLMLVALIWSMWLLLTGHSASLWSAHLDLKESEALPWIWFAAILVMTTCWTLASPIVKPRIEAAEHFFYRRWWKAADLPSAQLEERRDKRSPVLYLRSFHEDLRTLKSSAGDYERLEEVIGAPLRELGPLLAIGKPGELAFPGAARAYYSGSQWQEAVVSIMARAGFIVAVVGWTEGIHWEVETIKARGHLGKSIWVLPPDVEHHAVMCDWLRANFRATPYEQIVQAADLRRAIVVHLEVDGKLVVISGTRRDVGEYEAAIQTAVYGMVRHLVLRP